MKTFLKFIEEKEMGPKAKTALMADYTGKTPAKPPEPGKYTKDQPKNTGVNLVYGNKAIDPGLETTEADGKTPLAQMKTPGMEKATSLGEKPAPRPKVHKSSKKQLKEFHEQTKKLSDSEFVSYLMESKKNTSISPIHDLHGNPFTPSPAEAIGYITSLFTNPQIVSRFIKEMKRNGHMEAFVTELMDHRESHDEIVKLMGHPEEGRGVTDKFARAMADHHSAFTKEAGINESKKKSKIISEKVSSSLIDDDEDLDDMGHSGHPMEDPKEQEDVPGLDSSKDDMGNMDANGESLEEEPNHPKSLNAPKNMTRSIKGAFPDHFHKFCKDGSC